MMKQMLVSYTTYNDEQTVQIPVSYVLQKQGEKYTVSCTIDQKTKHKIPAWLRPFKFDIKFTYRNNVCETLYSDYEMVSNLDSSLFIDKVNAEVIRREKEFKTARQLKN